MDDNCSCLINFQEGCSKKVTMAIYEKKFTDFKSEVRFDLRGCLEALVASEAIIRDHIINMHMDM